MTDFDINRRNLMGAFAALSTSTRIAAENNGAPETVGSSGELGGVVSVLAFDADPTGVKDSGRYPVA